MLWFALDSSGPMSDAPIRKDADPVDAAISRIMGRVDSFVSAEKIASKRYSLHDEWRARGMTRAKLIETIRAELTTFPRLQPESEKGDATK